MADTVAIYVVVAPLGMESRRRRVRENDLLQDAVLTQWHRLQSVSTKRTEHRLEFVPLTWLLSGNYHLTIYLNQKSDIILRCVPGINQRRRVRRQTLRQFSIR